jgi:hypothetical protein
MKCIQAWWFSGGMTKEKSDSSPVHERGRPGIAMEALPGLSALCVICLVLSAPVARGGTFSATAGTNFPDTLGCFATGVSDGGSGFTSASVGPIPCAGPPPPFGGGTFSGTASASGSWVTGDFSASAVAAANPTGGFISANGKDTFNDAGLVTLPSGMTSALITFGVTGLSGVVGGGPTPSSPIGEGGFASEVVITLNMSAGGSSGTSGTSEACLFVAAVPGICPGGGAPLADFGPGSLAPITLTVHDGDYVQLSISVEAVATASAVIAPESANSSINVDPLFLTLPAGATFDSGITGFLSGEPPALTPEPSSAFLFATALLGLCAVRRRLA